MTWWSHHSLGLLLSNVILFSKMCHKSPSLHLANQHLTTHHMKDCIFIAISYSKLLQHYTGPLLACQTRVVPRTRRRSMPSRTLQTTTGIHVPQAMILAGFFKKDVTNEIVCQMVRRCYQQAQITVQVIINSAVIGDKPSLSDLTNNDDVQSPMSATSGSTNPKPQCKQIRLTSCSKQQQRVDDLEIKTHKLDAHKAAMHLYNTEQQKPNSMLSILQVWAFNNCWVLLSPWYCCTKSSKCADCWFHQ